MKNIILLAMALSFLAADQTYHLNVANMSCGGCAKNMQKLANTVATVKNMSFDTTTKDVNLTLEDKDDIEKVVNLLKENNYKAKLIK